MAYGTIYSDTIQGSTANTAPVFNDGNSREIGQLGKQWVRFDGSALTVKASFNNSSLTRRNTGRFTLTTTVAFVDSLYAAIQGFPGYEGATEDDRGGCCSIQSSSSYWVAGSDQGPSDNNWGETTAFYSVAFR